MAKKRAGKKAAKKAVKKGSATKNVAKKSIAARPRPTAAARLATAMAQPRQPATLADWFMAVDARMSAAVAAGAATGACIVPNPAGGANMCIPTDRATCKAMKGFFAGGAC
jgi:hypothetical protein